MSAKRQRLHRNLAVAAGLLKTFRRKKDRSDELLHAIQYERILAYEALGANSRARQELEKLYAEAQDYADVAERLGLLGRHWPVPSSQ